jgi:translation initiation factor 2 alpha subunit (eIF-2alpha)
MYADAGKRRKLVHNGQKVVVGVSNVKEERQAVSMRKLNVVSEPRNLNFATGEALRII